jgi:hypothetical protein
VLGGWGAYVVDSREARGATGGGERPSANYPGLERITAEDAIESVVRASFVHSPALLRAARAAADEARIAADESRAAADETRAAADESRAAADADLGAIAADLDALPNDAALYCDCAILSDLSRRIEAATGAPAASLPDPPPFPLLAVSVHDDVNVLALEQAVLPYVHALETLHAAFVRQLSAAFDRAPSAKQRAASRAKPKQQRAASRAKAKAKKGRRTGGDEARDDEARDDEARDDEARDDESDSSESGTPEASGRENSDESSDGASEASDGAPDASGRGASEASGRENSDESSDGASEASDESGSDGTPEADSEDGEKTSGVAFEAVGGAPSEADLLDHASSAISGGPEAIIQAIDRWSALGGRETQKAGKTRNARKASGRAKGPGIAQSENAHEGGENAHEGGENEGGESAPRIAEVLKAKADSKRMQTLLSRGLPFEAVWQGGFDVRPDGTVLPVSRPVASMQGVRITGLCAGVVGRHPFVCMCGPEMVRRAAILTSGNAIAWYVVQNGVKGERVAIRSNAVDVVGAPELDQMREWLSANTSSEGGTAQRYVKSDLWVKYLRSLDLTVLVDQMPERLHFDDYDTMSAQAYRAKQEALFSVTPGELAAYDWSEYDKIASHASCKSPCEISGNVDIDVAAKTVKIRGVRMGLGWCAYGDRSLASFHTHPNRRFKGWAGEGPSVADLRYAISMREEGLVWAFVTGPEGTYVLRPTRAVVELAGQSSDEELAEFLGEATRALEKYAPSRFPHEFMKKANLLGFEGVFRDTPCGPISAHTNSVVFANSIPRAALDDSFARLAGLSAAQVAAGVEWKGVDAVCGAIEDVTSWFSAYTEGAALDNIISHGADSFETTAAISNLPQIMPIAGFYLPDDSFPSDPPTAVMHYLTHYHTGWLWLVLLSPSYIFVAGRQGARVSLHGPARRDTPSTVYDAGPEPRATVIARATGARASQARGRKSASRAASSTGGALLGAESAANDAESAANDATAEVGVLDALTTSAGLSPSDLADLTTDAVFDYVAESAPAADDALDTTASTSLAEGIADSKPTPLADAVFDASDAVLDASDTVLNSIIVAGAALSNIIAASSALDSITSTAFGAELADNVQTEFIGDSAAPSLDSAVVSLDSAVVPLDSAALSLDSSVVPLDSAVVSLDSAAPSLDSKKASAKASTKASAKASTKTSTKAVTKAGTKAGTKNKH